MKISVVIPTYNRRTLLARTLPTVFAQNCSPGDYEIIVVVDGSTDGTTAMLLNLRPTCAFQVLEQPNQGQAVARNAGLKAARGELVLFLDDDLVCDSKLLGEHIAAHRLGENMLVFGPLYVSPESPRTLATLWIRSATGDWIARLSRQGEARWPVDAIVLPNSSIRRETLLALGGFDELLVNAHEDTELGLRLWRAGVRFHFHAPAVTYQFYVKSTRDLVRKDAPAYGRNEVRLCLKRPEFRAYSQLARHSEIHRPKRWAREIAVRMPILLDLLLRVPCWLAERLPGIEPFRQTGLRMLWARQGIAMLRSAVSELGGWKNFQREFAVRLPVLLYHHVGPDRPGTYPGLTVSPRRFENQVQWLKRRGYVGIRPSDWLAWCREGKPLPKKPVLLTFDDAYADIAEYALPLLKKYGFGAGVFVVTEQIGGTNAWDEKTGSATLRCMTAEQIREWAAQGVEFGAHSRTHPDFSALNDGDLQSEIAGSGQALSGILGTPVISFAYPFGVYSDIAKKHAQEVFGLAFACEEGLNGLSTDPYLLRRVMVEPNDTLADLAFYVTLGWNPIKRLRARLRLRTRLTQALQAASSLGS